MIAEAKTNERTKNPKCKIHVELNAMVMLMCLYCMVNPNAQCKRSNGSSGTSYSRVCSLTSRKLERMTSIFRLVLQLALRFDALRYGCVSAYRIRDIIVPSKHHFLKYTAHYYFYHFFSSIEYTVVPCVSSLSSSSSSGWIDRINLAIFGIEKRTYILIPHIRPIHFVWWN